MNIIYQDGIAEIGDEAAAHATAIWPTPAQAAELRRAFVVAPAGDLRAAATMLETDLADRFAGLRWYFCPARSRMKRQCSPVARYRAKLTWRQSLAMLRTHRVVARKVSIYEYSSLADAVRDAAFAGRRSGCSGIVATDLPANVAVRAARDCHVRPSAVAAALAGGRIAFFAMLMAGGHGIDLYWRREAELATAPAEPLTDVRQSV